MTPFHTRLFGAVVALTLAAGCSGARRSSSNSRSWRRRRPAAAGTRPRARCSRRWSPPSIARSVQVTNVAGAGGSVGIAQFVNGAKGDGNQLMVNGFVMVGALAMNKSPVTLDQVTPIARLTEEIQVIVVPANSPIKTAQDLAAAVKADIAKVTFAGGSAGGVDHIMAALFAGAIGADAKKVNYIPFSGGGESLAAILGGKVTAGISGLSEYEGQIKSGKLRALGVTSEKRIARRRHSDLQGAGHRPRARQLALGGRAARHHRRAEEDPERCRSRRWSSPTPGRTSSSRRAGTTPISPAMRSPIS